MRLSTIAPGALLVVAIAAAGFLLAPFVKTFAAVDATLIALLLGLAVGAIARHPPRLDAGAQVTLKRALMWGVVLLGAEVNLAFLLAVGPEGLALAAALIAFTFVAFLFLARALRVEGDTWALLGAGTGICGLSAVVAMGATLKSRERDVAIAVAGVGLLSAVGLLVYPLLGALFAMTVPVYGAWSGLSVHAVANAIAAGFAYGPEAGSVATLTKLTRVALLAPTLIVLALMLRRGANAPKAPKDLLPPMVWGFLAVVLATSLLPLPGALVEWVKLAAKALLVLGMAALGYTTRLGHVRDAGPRGIALAVLGWVALSAVAYAGAWVVFG